MKILASILLLLMPMVTVAQNYQNMNEEDMQKMMQQMQKMQSCMQNIDQAKLEAIDQRSSQILANIDSLCASGKRDEAQEKAISYGKEMAKDPTMKEMRNCGEMMSGEMMQGMMPKTPLMDLDKDFTNRHVCD